MSDHSNIKSQDSYAALKKEYENFSYIVSHDFNAPLRHIKEFSKLLVSKLGDRVGPDEKKYVDIIEKSVLKAEAMLDALLQISRLDSRAEPYQAVDCNKAVEDAQQSLARKIDDYNIEITVSELPIVHADKMQVTQLFYQLLDNAIKFRSKKDHTAITIRASQQEDAWLFHVEDNGEGVDDSEKEQIFSLFHTREEFPGVGAGLAICQKIITRHGGTIWYEKGSENRSIFAFTFPVSAP